MSFLEVSRRLQNENSSNDFIDIAKEAVNTFPVNEDFGIALDALPELIAKLEQKMRESAKELDFEQAANLRDRINKLRHKLLGN